MNPNTKHQFVALYEGKTIAEARVIAASAASDLVEVVAARLGAIFFLNEAIGRASAENAPTSISIDQKEDK
jgi:predicted nicotinamide N-methyase